MNDIIKNIKTEKNLIEYGHDGKTVTVNVMLESQNARNPFCLLPKWIAWDEINKDMRGSMQFDGTDLQAKIAALREIDFVERELKSCGVQNIENQLAPAIASGKAKGLL